MFPCTLELGTPVTIHNALLAKRNKVSTVVYTVIGKDPRDGTVILALGSEATLWVHWSKLRLVVPKP